MAFLPGLEINYHFLTSWQTFFALPEGFWFGIFLAERKPNESRRNTSGGILNKTAKGREGIEKEEIV
jgi:hypothetical protein